MLSVPWKPQSHGVVTTALVENVDMYPTLAVAAGLPAPPMYVLLPCNWHGSLDVHDNFALSPLNTVGIATTQPSILGVSTERASKEATTPLCWITRHNHGRRPCFRSTLAATRATPRATTPDAQGSQGRRFKVCSPASSAASNLVDNSDLLGCVAVMGYSVRTDSFRFTEWFEFNATALRPIMNATVAMELYDHTTDAGDDFNRCIYVSVHGDRR